MTVSGLTYEEYCKLRDSHAELLAACKHALWRINKLEESTIDELGRSPAALELEAAIANAEAH